MRTKLQFPPGFTLVAFTQTGYFGALRLSGFVVDAFHCRGIVLLFHCADTPLGPSHDQGYKKQLMLLVTVLSDLHKLLIHHIHKAINTPQRDILL